jgi:hypothetical protein
MLWKGRTGHHDGVREHVAIWVTATLEVAEEEEASAVVVGEVGERLHQSHAIIEPVSKM